MLSIGWTEMMIVAAIALIVVGPKDLPGMLRHIGKMAGSVRRMGNDFKNELNKVTAVDELKNIKHSIAAPLTDTKRQIEKEFNSIAPTGSVIPSGKITPKDPNAESVVDEIREAAGMSTEGAKVAPSSGEDAVKASMAASVAKAKSAADARLRKAATTAKSTATQKSTASEAVQSTSKSVTAKTTGRKSGSKKSTAPKSTAPKSTAPKSTAPNSAARKTTTRKTTPRKQVTKKTVKSDS